MITTTDPQRADLLARYATARHVVAETSRLHAAATRTREALALILLGLDGRGSTPAADWIRAHLAGDSATANRIAAEHPRTYFDDEPRATIEVERVADTIPVTVDL